MDTGLIIALIAGAIFVIGPKLLPKKKRQVGSVRVVSAGYVAPRGDAGKSTMIAILVTYNVLGIAMLIATRVNISPSDDAEKAIGTLVVLVGLYLIICCAMSFVAARIPGHVFLGFLCVASCFGWVYLTWLACMNA